MATMVATRLSLMAFFSRSSFSRRSPPAVQCSAERIPYTVGPGHLKGRRSDVDAAGAPEQYSMTMK